MDFRDIQVRTDVAYPEIVGARRDPQTVAIIKNLATARTGELKAILQYIYQAVISDKTNQEIARIFEEIGVVEMMHLDLLMHAETLFGGDARYEDSQGNMFNISLMNYTTKLKDMLDYNIMAENRAIENYSNAIDRVENESLKQLFARIIQDEKKHIEAFEAIRNNVEFLSL